MTETPTREELLEARIAFVEAWQQAAERKHVETVVLLRGAEEAQWETAARNSELQDQVAALLLTLGVSVEAGLKERGCCKKQPHA